MKSGAGTLTASLYGSNVWPMADLYTFYLDVGVTRWTPYSQDVVSASLTWSSGGPYIERGSLETAVGMQVATLDITLAASSSSPGTGTIALGGMTLFQYAAAGRFDGARVVLDQAVFDSSGNLAGTSNDFDGTVVEVRPSSARIVLTVKSFVAILNEEFPRRAVQPQCPYRLYGPGCELSSGSFASSRTAASGSTTTSIVLNTSTPYAGSGGWITFTFGALNGVTRTVLSVAGTTLTLASPLGSAPAVGDALMVYQGCDRSRSTCRNTFSNIARFGGFPDSPRPNTQALTNHPPPKPPRSSPPRATGPRIP